MIASIDNLTGFEQAIRSIFPQTDVQLCIVHQIRNSIKYVPWKDEREVIRDMKSIYKANTYEEAEKALAKFDSKWSKQYKAMVTSWKRNWEGLTSFYNYPEPVRKILVLDRLAPVSRSIRFRKSKALAPSFVS